MNVCFDFYDRAVDLQDEMVVHGRVAEESQG